MRGDRCYRIEVFNEIVNKTEVDLCIDFTQQVIGRNELIDTDEFEGGLGLGAIF